MKLMRDKKIEITKDKVSFHWKQILTDQNLF